jgi:hypothetical protein
MGDVHAVRKPTVLFLNLSSRRRSASVVLSKPAAKTTRYIKQIYCKKLPYKLLFDRENWMTRQPERLAAFNL